jgi:PhnB protein
MSKVKAVPEGMHSLTAQLSIDNAGEAIDFYKKAFGAEEIDRAIDPSGKKVWHAMVRIGDSMLFVNDTFPEMGGGKQTATLWLYVDGVDAMFKRATDAGCSVKMPLMDMFWGDRMGQVTDKWGVTWCLAQRVKVMTKEEMKKAGDEFAKSMQK